MIPPCRDFLESMLEAAPQRPPADGALEQHLASCASCRAAFARMCALHAAFGGLPALRAPAALDGLVVAATQAGHRQERALAHLRTSLRNGTRDGRQAAPAGLDLRMGTGGAALGGVRRVAAPSVLERLVDEDLRDPRLALTRRYVARLGRMGTPPSLGERVARMFGQRREPGRRGLLLASTALLVLAGTIWGWWRMERTTLRPRFQVVYVDDLEQLDPLARDLLYGATGGWSELRGKAR
jgi:hypothetical protein